MIKLTDLLFENTFKLASTKPPKSFGVRKAIYKNKDGKIISVIHSDYSSAMRTGSATNGYSSVWEGDNILNSKDFKGDNHVNKAIKYLNKIYGIIHDPSKLEKYKG